eukprot:m51a1_g1779 putative plasminogen activator inhibitor (256) ;mRNA; r:339021-339920
MSGSETVKEQRPKLAITRPVGREGVQVRPGKRQFERHSGTGRGREQRKDGAGKANWGRPTDPKEDLAAAEVEKKDKEVAAQEAKEEATSPAPEAADKPAEKPAAEAPKEEEPKPVVEKSLTEFLNERRKLGKKVPKFSAAPAGEVTEQVKVAAVEQVAAAVAEEAKPAAAVPVAPKEAAAAPKPAAKKEKIQLNFVFYDEAERRASRGRPQREGEERRGPRNPRPAQQQHQQQPRHEAKAAAVAAPAVEEFPKLH